MSPIALDNSNRFSEDIQMLPTIKMAASEQQSGEGHYSNECDNYVEIKTSIKKFAQQE
jgi:hypothetical protein